MNEKIKRLIIDNVFRGVEVDNLYYFIEDEFDLSVDGVILLSRNS